jgi:hypothetical protein
MEDVHGQCIMGHRHFGSHREFPSAIFLLLLMLVGILLG